MTRIICARHGTPHIEAGGCLVCAAEAAQRRVASARKACPHNHMTIEYGVRTCTSCGVSFGCEHRDALELPGNGMLGGLRQCADCKLLGFDAGDHVAWMAPRSADETER